MLLDPLIVGSFWLLLIPIFIAAPARDLFNFLFGLGYWWMSWDPQRDTWHDKMTGTRIVPRSGG
jgi:hypothetical protein